MRLVEDSLELFSSRFFDRSPRVIILWVQREGDRFRYYSYRRHRRYQLSSDVLERAEAVYDAGDGRYLIRISVADLDRCRIRD